MSHFAIYVRWLFGWRYISSLHSSGELQLEKNSCPLLRCCFVSSCLVGVSKSFSRSISLTVFWLYTDSTQHVLLCYVPFLFFKYILSVNRGQDIHFKKDIFVKI